MFTVSINPTYYCNFRCDFCYLTKQQLSDPKKIDLDRLDHLLSNVPLIGHIDLYGGEIGLLTDEYFYKMKSIIRKYYNGPINIITNLSALRDFFFDEDIDLSVSYDFESREKSELVFKNIMLSTKPLSVLVLANKQVIQYDVDYMISMLNLCNQVKSVEIKPYSINQANSYDVTHRDFENFVIKWLQSPIEKNFEFINEYRIQDSLEGKYSAYSDNHIYITPSGNYGVLEFDEDDKEYFLELNSWKQYLEWCDKEKATLAAECYSCQFVGRCLTEHYRHIVTEHGCCGYKGLLQWYSNQ